MRHEDQNRRMREWFANKTRLPVTAPLHDHMDKLDKMLGTDQSEVWPRPPVLAFAIAMEKKLREKDAIYSGWKDASNEYLQTRLIMEVSELADFVEQENPFSDPEHNNPIRMYLRWEAVDVANFAMMLFDNNEEVVE